MEKNNSLENNQTEDDQGPFLTSDVKEIFKKRKEEKNKKGMKKMNLKSLLPSEEQEINSENKNKHFDTQEEEDDDDDNESDKMISQNNMSNEDNMKLEKKAKKNYKTIFNLHKNYDINFNSKANDIIKNKKNNTYKLCFKESFFLGINIIAFIFFILSFNKTDNEIIYYYLIYPINKISLIYLIINAFITSLILLFILVNVASVFHLFYMLIFYMSIFYQYHLSNNNTISINYFDPANCHFFIYAIIMLHILGIFAIIYYVINYFYLNGQLNQNESCLIGFLIDYWETERKIEKLEKYINLNLDQLITSKGYSYEENIINKKKNKRVVWSIISLGLILVSIHIFLMVKKNDIFNCNYLDLEENNITKPYGYCYMNKLTGFFDVYNNDMSNCTKSSLNNNFNKEQFVNNLINDYNNKKISKDTKYFAFPLTNNKDFYFSKMNNNNLFEKKVNQEIYDFEKNPNDKAEAILNIENEKNPKLKINLKYNEQLANERKKMENKESLFNNVLVLHFTGVSQFYFKTALPKLYSFFENYKFKEHDKNNKMTMESFQFGKYHSFNDDILTNKFLMYYDSEISSIKDIKSKIINNKNIDKDINDHLQYFQENGYITGQSLDMCSDELLYSHRLKSKNTFWDHEIISPFCSPIFINNILTNNYCLNDFPFYSYQIDYATNFWLKYKENKKYFKFTFISTNEKTGSLLSYLDGPLYDFLIQLKFKGLLENTAIFFMSEIGGVQDNIYYNFGKNSEKEMNMKFGSFLIILGKKNNLNESEYKFLYDNTKIMVTPFDVYTSLVHIAMGNKIKDIKLYLDEGKKGESIFKKIEKNERNCEFYNDWMHKDYCYFHR